MRGSERPFGRYVHCDVSLSSLSPYSCLVLIYDKNLVTNSWCIHTFVPVELCRQLRFCATSAGEIDPRGYRYSRVKLHENRNLGRERDTNA